MIQYLTHDTADLVVVVVDVDEIPNFHLMTRFMLFALFKCFLMKYQKRFVPFNNYLFETRAAMLLIFYSSITGKFNYN